MSHDLYVWGGPPMSAAEFSERLRLLDTDIDETSLFTRSERLVRWRNELLARYPPLEDASDDGRSRPWAMTPIESARCVELNLQRRTPDDQLLDILSSALTVGLYVFDPQGPTVYRPGPARWQILFRRLRLSKLAGPDP